MLKIILIILAALIIVSGIEITMYKRKTKQDEVDIEEAMKEFLRSDQNDKRDR